MASAVTLASPLRFKREEDAAAAAALRAGGSGRNGGDAAATSRAVLDEAVYTKQTCYVQTDESEICVYHGTLCFDGLSPIVVVDKPVRDPERINDFTHSCMDPRFYEPSSLEDGGCAYMNSGMRKARRAPAALPPRTSPAAAR